MRVLGSGSQGREAVGSSKHARGHLEGTKLQLLQNTLPPFSGRPFAAVSGAPTVWVQTAG